MSSWRVGTDVPLSVSWTSEQSFDLKESSEFPGWVDLVQQECQGKGDPKFATLHVSRQRRAMHRHLCHVCGRQTLARDRYIFPLVTGGFVTLGDETMRYASTVPSVHLDCAKKAQKLCPHIHQSMNDPVPFPSEETDLHPRPNVPAGMEELEKTLPRGLKVVFSSVRVFGPRFSRRIARLRNDAPI
ncbi:hypothetical protein [Acidisoma silvae]|uniref:Uncharacterized protein n=1 Tax=Acidisoma silvae TaxID=2802396 RepID=A0A963YY04_9PROT|nr:hypothetical protein [Acidisoma silvae]MCB8878345.1 hypothetical protein [Acidisoma silvae]